MDDIKQVIIVRKDLNMRKGKMVAQGCHASLTAYLQTTTIAHGLRTNFVAIDWAKGDQKKICVGVDSEQELHDLYMLAVKAGLPASLILDKGLTEFKQPTYTAVGIGPALAEHVDKITGKLKLL